MDVLVTRCAGLDVHRDTVVATVRSPGKRRGMRAQETRTYPTTQTCRVRSNELLRLVDRDILYAFKARVWNRAYDEIG